MEMFSKTTHGEKWHIFKVLTFLIFSDPKQFPCEWDQNTTLLKISVYNAVILLTCYVACCTSYFLFSLTKTNLVKTTSFHMYEKACKLLVNMIFSPTNIPPDALQTTATMFIWLDVNEDVTAPVSRERQWFNVSSRVWALVRCRMFCFANDGVCGSHHVLNWGTRRYATRKSNPGESTRSDLPIFL